LANFLQAKKIFIKEKALQQKAKGLGIVSSPDRTIFATFV